MQDENRSSLQERLGRGRGDRCRSLGLAGFPIAGEHRGWFRGPSDAGRRPAGAAVALPDQRQEPLATLTQAPAAIPCTAAGNADLMGAQRMVALPKCSSRVQLQQSRLPQ
jgi:hypothetical protein